MYLDGKPLDATEIAKLADLESREVLLGKLAGAMLASLSQAVYLLNAPLAQAARLAGALQAKAEQDPSILDGGAGEPAAAAEEPPRPRTLRPTHERRGHLRGRPAEETAEDARRGPRETTEAEHPRQTRPDIPAVGHTRCHGTATGKEPPPWRSSAPTSCSTRSRR